MGSNIFIQRGYRVAGGASGGGGTIRFRAMGPIGTLTSFTLPGTTDSNFNWTPQAGLENFEVTLIGGGAGGGGSAGKSSRTESLNNKVTTTLSLAVTGSGGGGGGGAYTRRTYDQIGVQNSVVYNFAVASGNPSGGGNDTGGYDNDQNRTGGTGSSGGTTTMGADVNNAGNVVFLTASGGTGGSGGNARLTSVGCNNCFDSCLTGGGGGFGSGGTVSVGSVSGITLMGTAVDEDGSIGAVGQVMCCRFSNTTGSVCTTGLATGGSSGAAGSTAAAASGFGGAGVFGSTSGSNGPGIGNGPNGTIGENFGGGGAGGSGQMQGSNFNPDGDTTSVVVAQSGGLGTPGMVRLTFVWSGTADDQPKDSNGNVIAPS